MKLNKIEDIVSGQKAFMPSGFEAVLTKTDSGVDVQYNDGVDTVTDHYTNDQFNDIIAQGVELIVNESLKEESLESFENVDPSTDVAVLDLPVTLAKTIPVDNEGQVITMQTLFDAICDLKSMVTDIVKHSQTKELVDAQDTEDDEIVNGIVAGIDVEDVENEDDLEDLENIEDTEDIEAIEEMCMQKLPDPKETKKYKKQNKKKNEDIENKRYVVAIQLGKDDWDQQAFERIDQAVQAFKQLKPDKYSELVDAKTDEILLTNEQLQEYLEDVNTAKKQVDNMIKDKKSPEEIEAVIDYMTDNDSEKEQVTDYTISKMKESLLDTRRNSKLRGIIQ